MKIEQYPVISGILEREAPPHLYHYTSPTGLIGITKSKQLWATQVQHLNDSKELVHAVNIARNSIENLLRRYSSQGTQDEPELLHEMSKIAGRIDIGLFVVSLTEMGDQLSQWRGYCPPSGGYSIGFPVRQIRAMALAQDYYLSPCIYDNKTQCAIVNEILGHHLKAYRMRVAAGQDFSTVQNEVSLDFGRDISRFGPIIKHRSFHEEREWRLVSPAMSYNHPDIKYRPGVGSIIPYREFSLVDKQNPNLTVLGQHDESLVVTVGPNDNEYSAQNAQLALQSIMSVHIGEGCWIGGSDIPYRSV